MIAQADEEDELARVNFAGVKTLKGVPKANLAPIKFLATQDQCEIDSKAIQSIPGTEIVPC